MEKDIKKILEDNPDAFLYYHDNGSWVLYSRKFTDTEWESDDFNDFQETLILMEGDSSEDDGYVPSIVSMMAEALGIKHIESA